MQKKIKKTLLQRLMAVSAAVASTAALIPSNISAVNCIGQNDFDEGVGFPWYTCSAIPAEQQASISDGTYNIRIINPGGKTRGGDSRWDLSFRHRNIHIEAGHKYKVHWEVEASNDGELHTHIGSLDGYVGVWQNNSEQWNQGWNNVKISKGKNVFDSTFTASETLEIAEWAFHYGGAGEYQDIDCFPEGTELKFDNMILECATCGDEYVSETKTPCLWTSANKWNTDDLYGAVKPWSDVRINQLGYAPKSSKIATYATAEAKTPVSFRVLDNSGEVVYEGTGKFVNGEPIHNAELSKGYYADSGEYCQLLDFSEVNKPGTYTIEVDDTENIYTDKYTGKTYKKYISPEFKIGDDIYSGVLTDVMNYFYQNRSGIDIEEKYISSSNSSGSKSQLARQGTHKSDVAFLQNEWNRISSYTEFATKYRKDVTGGWYEADTNTKSVISGANAVWILQNMYEMNKANGSEEKWADGKIMSIPENEIDENGYPDVLDEARYELEFMFKMMVDSSDAYWGENYENFVYHAVLDNMDLGIPIDTKDYIYEHVYDSYRIVRPPTYSATFCMIACAAQAARLWKDYDPEFAKECLDNARKGWEAVMKYQSEWDKESNYYTRGKDKQFPSNCLYEERKDDNVLDEAYWAACELFATTGDESYYDYLKEYKSLFDASGNDAAFDITCTLNGNGGYSGSFGSFNTVFTAALGTLSLYLSDKTPAEDKKTIEKNIKNAANKYIDYENSANNGTGIPYAPLSNDDLIGLPSYDYTGYEYDSNKFVVNNTMIMAYAYDVTKDTKYLNGVTKGMDYIFGRNGLGLSYVTGYGSHYISNPRHKFWVNEIDRDYPMAPNGVLAAGPNSMFDDPYVVGLGINRREVAAQKCYADSVEAASMSTPYLELQAALAWNVSFIENGFVFADNENVSGDANCDNGVDMADVVLVMQSLANPDKYGLGGTDANAITQQGLSNADVDKTVRGLTSNDALFIQKYLLGLINKL